VTPATLVPRPETELLVEQAIGMVSRREPMKVLDLGTGSGAIALAIARERPFAEVVATDISEDALAVAIQNARQLDVANVEFRAGDWTAPVADMTFDVIVSNPPYVADDDPALDSLAFEPRSALAAGADGLDDIRRLAVEARDVIVSDGVLLIEHGAGQAEDVAGILEQAGWQDVRNLRDLAGLPRVTLGRAPRD
jgi:release factor glutamine methyltransferase